MHKKMYRLFLILISVILLGGCANKQSSEHKSETRLFLDTYCTITVHGQIESELLDKAFNLVEEYENLFSITVEGSDVWSINNANGEPVIMDFRTVEVIKAGVYFGDLTDGKFDITIGRLSRLWDFGSYVENSSYRPLLPSETELEAALGTVDYRQIEITGNTVRLGNPDAWIDLGAIAKGYIADKVAELLIEGGVIGALIDLGGDIVTVGNRSDGSPWRIGIREPVQGTEELIGAIEASGAAVISSGVYQRQFEIDGVIYHHILDPKTGQPAQSDVVSATFLTESAVMGEGASTIAVLVGSEGMLDIYSQIPGFIGAVLVLNSGEVLEFGDVRLEEVG